MLKAYATEMEHFVSWSMKQVGFDNRKEKGV